MTVLAGIASPQDLRRLNPLQVRVLAGEIREHLVSSVSRTGGHLGPNLGVVELTIALHRVFDSPQESIVFDTGHQCYVHKLLTGRQDFSALRKAGGISGYPSRTESQHDIVENSHASTSLAWAEGIARARRLRGESQRCTVAVIGDGALTGGMAWEALNNIAADKDLPLVVVVNDNERSYAPTAGGLAEHLSTLRMTQGYERFLEWGRDTLTRTPVVGKQMYGTLHGMKKGLKDMVAPQGMFEDLGLKYVGPVDGHDVAAVENALRMAKEFGGPVLVHVLTEKGRGYEPARNDVNDQFHAVGVIDPETGLPARSPGRMWTDVFSDAICAIGERRPDVVALTAAMLIPVGLQGFQQRFPARIFDVGIAEQHAVTMACGLAFGGMHPVVAIYATFLNRAFDQVLMDCALHQQGVTFVLDRAGITGDDGASHNGMWDMAMLASVPGLRLAAPRDPQQLVEVLDEAVDVHDAPTVVRFPKGGACDPIGSLARLGAIDVLHGNPQDTPDVLFVSVGALAPEVIAAARSMEHLGLSAAVVDPRWVLPVAPEVVAAASQATMVVVVEDGLREGGVGSAVSDALADSGIAVPVVRCGVPRSFLPHATRTAVLAEIGLDADGIAASASQAWARGGYAPRSASDRAGTGGPSMVARAS